MAGFLLGPTETYGPRKQYFCDSPPRSPTKRAHAEIPNAKGRAAAGLATRQGHDFTASTTPPPAPASTGAAATALPI